MSNSTDAHTTSGAEFNATRSPNEYSGIVWRIIRDNKVSGTFTTKRGVVEVVYNGKSAKAQIGNQNTDKGIAWLAGDLLRDLIAKAA